MKQALQLKVGQSLTMTPQLQQAIKLLQMSSLDLQQEITEYSKKIHSSSGKTKSNKFQNPVKSRYQSKKLLLIQLKLLLRPIGQIPTISTSIVR